MSAFLCSDDHVRLLAIAAARRSGDHGDEQEAAARRYVKWLREANNLSLAARYTDPDQGDEVELDWWDSERPEMVAWLGSPATIFKQVFCFDYQACEYDGWAASEANTVVLSLAMRYAAGLLPGDDAPWGIGDTERVKPNIIRLSDLCR